MADLVEAAPPPLLAPGAAAPLHLILIDGSGFIFRAFHALPPMNRPDGTPVNAVFGFTNMLAKLLKDHVGTHLAVIFDAGRLTFRNRLYDLYKAQRPDPPAELIPQFALVREATAAFGVPAIELADWEADDLIASYARATCERGGRTTIVSSDKDLMQLIRPGVDMLDPIKQKAIGPAEVMEKFGVTPDKLIDVQALMGDSVDNVPGVPGIGPKNAGAADQRIRRPRAGARPGADHEAVQATRHADRPCRGGAPLPRTRHLARRRAAPAARGQARFHHAEPERRRSAKWLIDQQGFRSLKMRVEAASSIEAAAAIPPMPIARARPAVRTEPQLRSPRAGSRRWAMPRRSSSRASILGLRHRDQCVTDAAEPCAAWVAEAGSRRAVSRSSTETDGLLSAARQSGRHLPGHGRPGRACYVPLRHDPAAGAGPKPDRPDGDRAPPSSCSRPCSRDIRRC